MAGENEYISKDTASCSTSQSLDLAVEAGLGILDLSGYIFLVHKRYFVHAFLVRPEDVNS